MTKKLTIISILLLIAAAGCSTPGKSTVHKDENGMWSQASAWKWYNDQPWMVGCNYLPSTACNQLEMWQEDTFDPETIDREFGWASEIGFNTMRIFLHDMMWEQDSEGFVKRIDKVLELAEKHNLKVLAKIPIDTEIAKACDDGEIEKYQADFLNNLTDILIKMEEK